jgi:hypothetical protein
MLELYQDYDRRSVHNIFDPASKFTVGAGTWGLQGILRVPSTPGGCILFVTLGKQEGAHQFDETINDEGILRWQSQPQQDLNSPVIAELITHDARRGSVHLFLRTARLRRGVAPPYTYLGPLRYFSHDAARARPAHLAWELLAWPIPEHVLARIGLDIVHEPDGTHDADVPLGSPSATLIEEEAPKGLNPIGESTAQYQARKVRYQSSDNSRALGLAGELLVLQHEKANLISAGRADLAAKVQHTSVENGDGAGFDIASFRVDGSRKFIEVKTTTGPKTSDFFISPNEMSFSASHAEEFELCRVFDFDTERQFGRAYRIAGDLRHQLSIVETQYRARPLDASES